MIGTTACASLENKSTNEAPSEEEKSRETLSFCRKVPDVITPDDKICGKFYHQIKSEQKADAFKQAPTASDAGAAGMDRSAELEQRARDEIERFDQWSGVGPAPQPIKAMEDLWRCNKFGDC
jgi:hypothetical protein